MKKFFTLILLLGLTAITATAQPSALFKGKEAAAPTPAQLLSQQPVSYAAPMRRAEAITEQPAGIVHDNLYRFSASYEASQLGKGVFRLSDGVVSTIVEGDDGYLYVKDPFSRFAYGSWIKGKLEGDTVTFEFPQFMYTEQSGGFTLDCYVSRMILNDDASSFVLDPNRQDMKFLWKNGTLTQLEEDPVMGMSTWVPELGNMWFWVGYADYNVRIEPLRSELVKLPEGAETEPYMLCFWPDDDTEDYRMTNVAVQGQDLYFNNISNTNPEAWVRGSFDGEELRLFSNDYLGISYRMNPYDPDQHIFSKTAREVKTYSQSGSYQSDYYPTNFIDFTRDEAGILHSDSVLAANAGTSRVYAEVIYRQPSLRRFIETAGTPADPTFAAVSEYSPTAGYGLMTINMPKLTTTGQRMNLSKLFYRIYLDDDVMTFYPDEYWYVYEPTLEMPYTHVDKRDFNIDVDLHRIFYYQSGFDRIGVQMVYYGGGEEHRSNIVYYDLSSGESSVTPGDGSSTQWGTRKAETYDVAIHLDGSMNEGKTIERLRIPFVDATPVTALKGFLTTSLALDDNGLNQPDLVAVSATPVGPKDGEDYGWTEITLAQPYTITADGVYVGYSFDISEATTTAGKRPVVTTAAINDNGLYVHTSRTYRRWQSIGNALGQTLAMQVVIGGLTENAASLNDLGEIGTQTDVTTPVDLLLRNHGSNEISSVDLTYSVAGLSGTIHKDFPKPLPARYDDPQPVSITLPAISQSNTYELSIRISKVNGLDNTDPHPEATGQLLVYGLMPKHRVLVEEYTGTWCGNCPRGLVAMEEMTKRYPDDFIGVSYHNADGMEVTTNFPTPVDAFPNASLDRTILTDPYYGEKQNRFGLEAIWKEQSEVAAPAAISVNAEWADEAQTLIRATANVTFPLASQNNYRVAYLLVADGLKGTGRPWAQVNYFQGTGGWELEGMQQFVNGDYYVQGLEFNDVVIDHSPWTGVAGSLPESVEGNTPISHTYEFKAASIKSLSGYELIQDKQRLRVVALLVNPKTGIVGNANKAPVSSATGISTQPTAEEQMVRAYFAPDGKRIAQPRRGLNIVRNADGTTAKVAIK